MGVGQAVTVPLPAGETTVAEVAVSAVTVAGLEPKRTAVVPDRVAPVMVTVVPPPVDP
jgi:hypothetical protein